MDLEIDVKQAHEELTADDQIVLLDCREQHEYDKAHLPGSMLLPTSVFLEQASTLEPLRDRRILVLCHHGVRSLGVTRWLRRNGYDNVQSIAGGIDAWSLQVDPSLPRY